MARKGLRLNIGCGDDIREGWDNIDLYPSGPGVIKADARKIPYYREADEILASHLLEHFWLQGAMDAILNWKQALKVGGKLHIIVPDADFAFKLALEKGANYNTIGDLVSWWATPEHIIYGADRPGRDHHTVWQEQSLRNLLEYLHFTDVKVWREWEVWHDALYATATKPDDLVDIVIPIWEGLRWTRRCIESLETVWHPYRLILVDDHSTDGTAKYLDEVKERRPDTILIRNDKNLGFVKSMNVGLEASDAPYVMWLNNDTMVLPHDHKWLDKMTAHFRGSVGAVGPVSDFVWGLQKHNLMGFPIHQEIRSLSGFCILVSREAADALGPLDEIFGVGGNDDLDYSIRLSRAGYKMVIARDAFIKHEGSASLKPYCAKMYNKTAIDRELVDRLDRETRLILIKKWGEGPVDEVFKDFRGWHVKGTIKLH